ncbi:MAG TPA: 16S rRNA (uracil(1498)-N(3))-methyltransferase [Rhodocyclaceae bacterium]|nr:16S rRNA (uracil(1498)-N(3))-methyltransferase [Rhodocyclaceae bacterium]
MIPRFHCSFPLAPGAVVELPAEAAHHAVKVLRLAEGDRVILFDGRGGNWQARLAPAGKSVRALLEAFDGTEREPPLSITLAQALPAADKMDWIVQKGVELGVAAVRPVAAKRSVVRLSGERMERRVAHWRGVAVAACEQSGRNRVPVVAPLVDLPQFLAAAGEDNGMLLLLSPHAELGLRQLPPPAGPVTLLVGPEGGFEESELAGVAAAGFRQVSLGPRLLRTETAGMAAIAAMMALWGDF